MRQMRNISNMSMIFLPLAVSCLGALHMFHILLGKYHHSGSSKTFLNGQYSSGKEKIRQKAITVGPFPVDYPFDDPSNYTGPIVRGWPPERSRYGPDYIRPDENTVITDLSCLSLDGTKILIIIQSNPRALDRRNINRQTWMQWLKLYPLVKVLFLFGTQDPKENAPYVPLDPEIRRYCDIVQMDFVDHYENITLDSISALKFTIQYDWKGEEPDFLLIGDDDTYINIPMLWGMLYEEKHVLRDSTFLIGFVWSNTPVYHPAPGGSRTDILSGMYVPTYLYKENTYPEYLSGCLYILPAATIDCIYSASLALPLFFLNDVHMTAFAAISCGYPRVHETRIQPLKIEMKYFRPTDIAFHYSNFKRMALIHQILERQNGLLNAKLANFYYIENDSLMYCDENIICTISAE